MAIVAVAGDACTTTTVALAAAWPHSDDSIVVEADPTGGDLAAWFDLAITPSLSTVVTRVLDGAWPEIESHTRLATCGLRVIPAPAREGEARQAVAESARSLVATLATLRSPVAIVDTGAVSSSTRPNPFLTEAATTVLVHRQSTQSARAAAVRLQRFAAQIETCAEVSSNLVVAVVGGSPFDPGEIEAFLGGSVGEVAVIGLPVDELAASVLAGRPGVSSRRLARLPLMRAARDLAAAVELSLQRERRGLWRGAR